VLDRVYRDRMRIFLDGHDSLHAQQPGAVGIRQALQPSADGGERLRRRPLEHKGIDRLVVRRAQRFGRHAARSGRQCGRKPVWICSAARGAHIVGMAVDGLKPRLEFTQRRFRDALHLAEDEPVGQQRLAESSPFFGERGPAKQGVHNGHHCIEPIAPGQRGRLGKQLQDRPGLGKPAGLHHDAFKSRNVAARDAALEAQQGFGEVRAHLAAHATAGKQHHILARGLDQHIIDADRPELVDDDGRVADRTALERRIEQRGLPRPQRPRQHQNRGQTPILIRQGA